MPMNNITLKQIKDVRTDLEIVVAHNGFTEDRKARAKAAIEKLDEVEAGIIDNSSSDEILWRTWDFIELYNDTLLWEALRIKRDSEVDVNHVELYEILEEAKLYIKTLKEHNNVGFSYSELAKKLDRPGFDSKRISSKWLPQWWDSGEFTISDDK
tara:strand:- start:104 stop:568 length:465 start_codon:yes stop_codon:yes gene_type:complete